MSYRADRLPIERCKVCRQEFRSKPQLRRGVLCWSKHCSKACSLITAHQPAVLTKARTARAAKMVERYAAQFMAEFGPLSEREIRLTKRAEDRGYRRGYQKAYAVGYRALKPREKAEAAA